MIYFDNASSTPLYGEICELLKVSFQEDFANPSSLHKEAKRKFNELELVRKNLLELVGVKNEAFRCIFTSSATESNNLLIKGVKLEATDEVLCSFSDHPSIVSPLKELEKNGVFLKTYLLENGAINIQNLLDQVNEKTKVLFLSLVNHQGGLHHNVLSIAEKVKLKNKSVLVHVDGTQGIGKVPFVMNEFIDSLSFSAHKINGPKGIGSLIVKKDLSLKPLFHGGGHEYGLRPSTYNLPLIKGFYRALEMNYSQIDGNYLQVKKMNETLREILLSSGMFEIPFSEKVTSPYILCALTKKIPSDMMMRFFEMKDVFCSAKSACSSKIKGYDPVLEAIGISEENHKNIIRFSFSPLNTFEELNLFKKILDSILEEESYFFKSFK